MLSDLVGGLLLLPQSLLRRSECSHLPPLSLLPGGSRSLLLRLRIGPCGIQLAPNLRNLGLRLVARGLDLPKRHALLLDLPPVLLSGLISRLLLLAQSLLRRSECSYLPLGLFTGDSRGLLFGLRIGPCGIQLAPNLGNLCVQPVARGSASQSLAPCCSAALSAACWCSWLVSCS